MISSYFASVGVGVDKQSLKNVDSYLKKIENKLKGFQKRVEKTSSVKVVLGIDQTRLTQKIRTAVSLASRGLVLRISKVEISRATLVNSINKAVTKRNPGQSLIKIDAQLSQASLVHMRRQVQGYLKGININATVNAKGGRVLSGRGSSGGNPAAYRTRDRGGLLAGQNPMLAGGVIGSMMRFGPYSLPFVAGAYGLNALANKAQKIESQQLLMNVSSQDMSVSKRQQEYLSKLGDRLGATTESMTPFFAQLVAGSRGTDMEKSLETGFSQFMDYASVVGLDDQQKEGALRAISQMLAKRRVQSEELRQQLAEHGMPQAVQIMADAVTGDGTRGSGDVAKLQKMMEMGQVDSIKALPLFFQALGREAAPWLEDYYKTTARTRGVSKKSQEDWMKDFLAGGGSTGVSVFFRTFSQVMKDSVQYAKSIGGIFEKASYVVSAAMLAPGEIFSFITGNAQSGNFLENLFGPTSGSKLFQGVIDSLNRIVEILTGQAADTSTSLNALGKILSAIDNALASILTFFMDAFEIGMAFSRGGLTGMKDALETTQLRRKAQEVADYEADAHEEDAIASGNIDFKVSRSERSKRANELFQRWQEGRRSAAPVDSEEDSGMSWIDPSSIGRYAGKGIRKLIDNYSPEENPHGWWNFFLRPDVADSVSNILPDFIAPERREITNPILPSDILNKLGLDSFGMLDKATGGTGALSNFQLTSQNSGVTIYQNNPISLNITEAQDLDEHKLSNLIERRVRDANEDMLNSAGVAFPRTVT